MTKEVIRRMITSNVMPFPDYLLLHRVACIYKSFQRMCRNAVLFSKAVSTMKYFIIVPPSRGNRTFFKFLPVRVCAHD